MARANIIVTPKKKAKKDRELKKQLRELEKFNPKELTAETRKRLIPLEEISKQPIKINRNDITFPQITENKTKKKRKKSYDIYQRKHRQKIGIKNADRISSKNKIGKKSKKKKSKALIAETATPPLIAETATPPLIAETDTPPLIAETTTPSLIADYIPTVDIFDMIEDAIFNKIPNETMIWRKGHKGGIPIDLTPLKQQAIFIIRDFASSDDKEVENYFRENENAIIEAIDGFTHSSTSFEFSSLIERFLNIINMGHALSADAMYYNEISEMLDFY